MPVKIKKAYEVAPHAGDSINDEDYLPFEQDLPGNASNSWGMKFKQLASSLNRYFYLKGESDSQVSGRIPLVPAPSSGSAVVQDSVGALVSTGLPFKTVEINTVNVTNWAQNSHTAIPHGLSTKPDFIHITAVFAQDRLDIGYVQGAEIETGLGNVGGSDLSAIVVETTSANFTIINSCVSANALLVPDKSTGTNASVAVGAVDVSLNIKFMAVI